MQVASQPAAGLTRPITSSDDGQWRAALVTTHDEWMAGAITGRSFEDDAARQDFITAVFQALRPVNKAQQSFSSCTDGRKRLALLDGSAVPVREQLVGTDTMCAFVAAEALGAHFYGDDLYKPVEVRIRRVVRHLLDNGYQPTAHIACGAAGGFTTVINRATQFIKDRAYIGHLKAVSDNNYNDTLHHLIVGSYQSRLVSGVYEGYRDGLVAEIVEEMVGKQAVERYEDDGRGVRGHREQLIVYLDESVRGFALDPNALIAATDSQVFVVNSARIDALAQAMSADDHQGIHYLTARLAIEDFSAAGHGTLAGHIETIIISRTS